MLESRGDPKDPTTTLTAHPHSTAPMDTTDDTQPQQQQDNNNTSSIVISSGHNDYILATALDAYGGRLATCSGDRWTKVWVLDSDASWILSHSWQAHASAVTDVAWAHPEFGTLLATASADHSWKVWQHESGAAKGSLYTLKATLTEARRAATCVEFAPRHWGLKVATGSADGCVRIYEAVDVANVGQWPLAATLTTAQQQQQQPQPTSHPQQQSSSQANSSSSSINAVAWCTGRFDAPTLAAASHSGCTVYRYSEQARNWQAVVQVSPTSIMDVAWAPNVGRRHHTLAMTTAAGSVRIVTLDRGVTNHILATQEMDDTVAWKCQWNVTGTVLATTGDAGLLQLYKKDPGTGQYAVVSQIRGDVEKIAGL